MPTAIIKDSYYMHLEEEHLGCNQFSGFLYFLSKNCQIVSWAGNKQVCWEQKWIWQWKLFIWEKDHRWNFCSLCFEAPFQTSNLIKSKSHILSKYFSDKETAEFNDQSATVLNCVVFIGGKWNREKEKKERFAHKKIGYGKISFFSR